jgi:hypothetical protein
MGPLSLDAQTALQLHQIILYCIAYVFAGAALVGVSVYIVLVCSEMFSQPRPQTQRARASRSARRVPVAEEALDLSTAETPILIAPERLGKEAVRVTAPPEGTQIPMMFPIVSPVAVGTWLRRIPRGKQVVHDGSFD